MLFAVAVPSIWQAGQMQAILAHYRVAFTELIFTNALITLLLHLVHAPANLREACAKQCTPC